MRAPRFAGQALHGHGEVKPTSWIPACAGMTGGSLAGMTGAERIASQKNLTVEEWLPHVSILPGSHVGGHRFRTQRQLLQELGQVIVGSWSIGEPPEELLTRFDLAK